MHVTLQHRQSKSFIWNLKSLIALVICFGLLIISLASPAMAGTMPLQGKGELNQANKALALRYAKEGWGTQPNWERVWDELVAPDMVLHFNSFPEPIVGLEANKAFSKELFQGFPTIHNTIEDVVADGNLVIYRSTLEGKQTGPFLGYPATGKKSKLNDFTQLRIENGKIVEQWYETNLLSGLQQLGLAPAIQ
jgi:predicted ester cyclase